MLESFLILFRETLEATLVVGIVLGFLERTGQSRHRLPLADGFYSVILVFGQTI